MSGFSLAIVACWCLGQTGSTSDLHPAFQFSSDDLLKVWDTGYKEASKKRDFMDALNKTRRGIGKIRTAPLREETVSWIWCWHSRQLAYLQGFEAKKKYLAPEEIEKQKELLKSPGISSPKTLDVYGILSIYPSFGRAYGAISRVANPNDLNDVRVVLQVDDRIYQPRSQPGHLEADSGRASNTVAVPQYDTSYTQSSASGQAYGSGGVVYGTATGTSTTVHSYTRYFQQGYDWYQGQFSATFDLFEKDGTPRLRKTDKEFTVIVVYGPNERKATYKLADLQGLFK
jgi:hypothetical protein